ncbi:hypothetical protein BCT30_00620 [Enterovibrio norvegicus]|uniref:hypothetical protein n=1 Tax=Enterovibrio norvegicus TaxID=188144 RepID=UPI000316C9B1|nr:hypothetical protein [Enterovibrio norvegicus]MCC4798202.1 hypothetical protein [Enterovibrio norvegicus]OEF49325.1 hypothetical protein A1OW_12980 [Enterovibrio norvegicus]PMH72199.1 hypothetical protein BCU62_04050 [Enterovibrio norvegicus]PMI37954.1 hypothetical protein BCU46_08885 [Enterovibrio norvegicus]PMN56579.1 hypothetical protein BCT30_00620 [Enterovibrio norvegicus]
MFRFLEADMVNVFYSFRGEHSEMQHVEVQTSHYHDAIDLIDKYPWREEVALFEEHGEGGGLFFTVGDEDDKYACFQLVPTEPDKGLLCFWLVLDKGFLGIFGKKTINTPFEEVSISEAKSKIKPLFNYSIEQLYECHKKS